jgi:hypothetical protein
MNPEGVSFLWCGWKNLLFLILFFTTSSFFCDTGIGIFSFTLLWNEMEWGVMRDGITI